MSEHAPGRSHRTGISLAELFRTFPHDAAAERWFVEKRWPNGICCHYCGSISVQTGAKHRTMPFRCRDCRSRFSVRTGTVMQSSKLGYQTWAVAIYLLTTSLKGVSSMKLHRDLNITQKSAWHLAHRLREMWQDREGGPFAGPVEADETFVGGKAKNMHRAQRERLTGRGGSDKTAVAGVRDRATKRVRAAVIERVDGPTLKGFVAEHTAEGATVYTDEASAYTGLANREAVAHGVGEYVSGQAHVNGMESFWSMLKRGYVGTYHRMSPEHLGRYVGEFEGRHNNRDRNTADQMSAMVLGAEGKRLRYADLIAHDHGCEAVAI